jgi:hypothetical protein
MVRIDPDKRTWDSDQFTLNFGAETHKGPLTIKVTREFIHDQLGCRGSQEELEQACIGDLDLIETTANDREPSWIESNGRSICTL